MTVGIARNDSVHSARDRETFTEFMQDAEPRLRQALVTRFGAERGREAAAEALAFGWERWSSVQVMSNPVGYLYTVGQSRALSSTVAPFLPTIEPTSHEPWVEPQLPEALAGLSDRQRNAVLLIYSYEWTYQEVADLWGTSRATVQRHVTRGMTKLRRSLEVSIGT